MAVGDATIEEASRALEECNGDVDGALTLVYDRAPPSNAISLRKVPYMEGLDNESIAKPSAAAVAPNALQGNGKKNVLKSYSILDTIMSHDSF